MSPPNQFEIKVSNELSKAFIFDIVFPNPKIENTDKEFSDIFIDFFNDIVIVQCKTCSSKDPERNTKKTIIDGLKQLRASFNRAIQKNISLELYNEIQGNKVYNFKNLENIYSILVVNEKTPFISYSFLKEIYPELKKIKFIPVIVTFDDLKFMMRELDTPKDFFNYLKKREEIIRTDKILFENEIELLSYYFLTGRSFTQSNVPEKSLVILNDIRAAYQKGKISEIIKRKKNIEKVSFWVDDLLSRLFLSNHQHYLKVAEELIKLNRFERRMLAECALEKCKVAFSENRDAYRVFKISEDSEVAFVFFFTRKSLKKRNEILTQLCISAKYLTRSPKIVGISHEPLEYKFSKPLSWDSLCYIEGNDYPNEEEMKKIVPMIWGTQLKTIHKDEYPKDIL